MYAKLLLWPLDHLVRHPWRVWFWGDSIGVEGLLDAAELTGDRRYLGFAHGLLKGWIAREQSRSEFDYTAPGVAMLRVWEMTRDGAMLDAARRHADYLAGFRTTTAGAFMRYENAAIELPPELPPEHADYQPNGRSASQNGGPCIFVDCVHFDGPFFAKLYQVTGEDAYRDLALRNILPQIELLYDRDERLFHHFWIERSQRPNGVLWGRGNGWGLLGVALTLEYLGGAATDAVAPLREVLAATLGRLKDLQDKSGAWHTVLTDPVSYVESSTAAFFVDIIVRAIRLGIVPENSFAAVLESAMRYIISHVDSGGVFQGVSYETFPSTRLEHYRGMPRGAVVPWGQGPLVASLRSWADLKAPYEVTGDGTEFHATRR